VNGDRALFDSNIIIYLSKREMPLSIVDIVIKIRKKKRIKIPDAIISATAISEGLFLVTRNVEDFKDVNVKITNPFE